MASYAATWQDISVEFTQGRISKVKSFSDTALKEAQERTTLPSLNTLGMLSEMCIRAMDTPCAARLNLEIFKLFQQLPQAERSSPIANGLFLQALARGLRIATATNFSEGISQYLALIPARIDHSFGFELGWIDAALAVGEAHLRQGNKLEAEKFIERAWGQFIGRDNNSPIDIIHYVRRFSYSFLRLGQAQRALQTSIIGWSVVKQVGRISHYDSLQYLGVMLLIQESIGNLSASVDFAVTMLDEIKTLEYDAEYAEDLRLEIEARLTLSCHSARGLNCAAAYDIAERHRDLFSKIWAKKKPISDGRRLSIIASTLFLAGSGTAPPDWLRGALADSQFTEGILEPRRRAQSASIGRFVGALNSPRLDVLTSEINSIFKENLRQIESAVHAEPFDLAPLGGTERLVNDFAMQARIASGSSDDITDSDVFLIAELANKSPSRIDAKYAHLVSMMPDRGSSLAFQQVRRLREDIQLLERRLLARIVQKSLEAKAVTLPDAGTASSTMVGRLQMLKRSLHNREAGLGKTIIHSPPFANALSDLRNSISDGDRYITSFISAGSVYTLCVSKHEFWLAQGPFDPISTNLAVKLVKAALGNPGAPSEVIDKSFPIKQVDFLTRSFLTPISECLVGAEELVFSLPQNLSGIPVHVFLDPLADSLTEVGRLGTVPWLGLRYSIRMVSGYEQVVAGNLRNREPNTSNIFIGVGDPVLRGRLEDGQPRTQTALRGVLPTSSGSITELDELPDTGDELRSLGKFFGADSRVFLRDEASELNLRRIPLRSARILAFATHGLTREEVPGISESALVLTPISSTIPAIDGVLTATDISRLDLDSDLVILSACNSASFSIDLFGPEAGSLSTAFFLAGAKSTLASLWSVNSDASRRLMEEFAKAYSKGNITPAKALRLAMISFLNDGSISSYYQHPRFWAAFTVFGGGSASPGQARPRQDVKFEEIPGVVNRPGHLMQAIDHNGLTIVAGAEPEAGSEVYTGFIKAINVNGDVVWKNSEIGRFFSLASSETNGYFYSLGYPAPNSKNKYIEIKQLDARGQQQSAVVVPIEKPESPGTAFLLSTEFMAVFGHLNSSDDARLGTNKVRIINLKSGSVSWEWALPESSDRLFYRRVQVRPAGMNELWVVVADKWSREKSEIRLGSLGWPLECSMMVKTMIFRLNPETRSVSSAVSIENHFVTDLLDKPHGEVFLASERYDGCLNSVDYGVSRLSDPNQFILSSRDFYGLNISTLKFYQSGNSTILTGIVTRDFDSADLTQRSITRTGVDPVMDADPNRSSGVLVAFIDDDLRPVSIDYIFTGLDSFIEAITPTQGNRAWRGFGSTADRQLGLTIRLSN